MARDDPHASSTAAAMRGKWDQNLKQHSFDFELNLLIFGQLTEQNAWVVQF